MYFRLAGLGGSVPDAPDLLTGPGKKFCFSVHTPRYRIPPERGWKDFSRRKNQLVYLGHAGRNGNTD